MPDPISSDVRHPPAALPSRVWVLTLCQALMSSSASMVIFCASLVGVTLAPSPGLATLPIAAFVVGIAAVTAPTALLMGRLGRKAVFLIGALNGFACAWLAVYSMYRQSFVLFCAAAAGVGATLATVQQYRFAAMEGIHPGLIPKAASTVLLGGLVAAFVGPEVGFRGRHLFGPEFVGSFIFLSALYLASFVILLFCFRDAESENESTEGEARPIGVIAAQPVFWAAVGGAAVGYAVMAFIMTATPVSMHAMDGHSLESTKWVIQSHVMAMYLPSLITASLIRRWGEARLMLGGLVALAVCLVVAYAAQGFVNYWTALVLLGVGWNFLFIGGTTLLPQAYRGAERFKVQALNEFVVFGVQAVASLSSGWFLFQLGWRSMLLIALPLLVLQLLLIFTWRGRSRLQQA